MVPLRANVSVMPGHIVRIGADLINWGSGPYEAIHPSDDLTESLGQLLQAINEPDSSNSPLGCNDTILFSTPVNPTNADVLLNDTFALQNHVYCGAVPRSKWDAVSIEFKQGLGPQDWYDAAQISVSVKFGFENQDGTIMQFEASTEDESRFSFGGPISSRSAIPSIEFSDVLYFADLGNLKNWPSGTMGFAYISLDNNSMRTDPSLGYHPPIVRTFNFTNWFWVTNNSLSLAEQQENVFLKSEEITFYVYPLACGFYSFETSAVVQGDGTLQSFKDVAPANMGPRPFIRPSPSHDIEKAVANFTAALVLEDGSASWTPSVGLFETAILSGIVNGSGLHSMETFLSSSITLGFGLLVDRWRTDAANGNPTSTSTKISNKNLLSGETWSTEYALIEGAQPRAFTQLRISSYSLFVGIGCTTVLVLVSVLLTMNPWGRLDEEVLDGGVIDLLSMLAGSTLPDIIAGEAVDSGTGRMDVRRARSERTCIKYRSGHLDAAESSTMPSSSSSNSLGRVISGRYSA